MYVSKNDQAWEQLFEKHNIVEEVSKYDIFKISSKEINEFREARLMTKFDHSDNLPVLFKKHNLTILPDSRGTYIIGNFKAYQKLKVNDIKPISMNLPASIESLDPNNITSEAVALNIAHASGMIDYIMNHHIDNRGSSLLTLSGRMGSGNINYKIKSNNKNQKNKYHFINVKNSQIEIDASYENLNFITVLEAKNKLPKDFLIRQLYYPYRFYKGLQINKTIKPVFFTYADEVFNFYIYEFKDQLDYTSIKQTEQYSFILNEVLNINLNEVLKISHNSPMLSEPFDLVYPQADNFTRILDMLNYLKIPKNKFTLAQEYEFDVRQSDYYANALVYLGLAVKNEQGNFTLNNLGRKVSNLKNSNQRNRIIIKQILSHKTFKLAFDSYIKNNRHFDREYVTELILKHVPTVNKINTAKRRSSTVKSWIEWILSVIK